MNQMPFNFSNIPNSPYQSMTPFQDNNFLEQRIQTLEQKVQNLENNIKQLETKIQNNPSDDYFKYQNSMHMM